MILCAKCKKKPDSIKEEMRVANYRYDVTVECHGDSETRQFTHKELKSLDADEIRFFSPTAPVVKTIRRSKVSSGT